MTDAELDAYLDSLSDEDLQGLVAEVEAEDAQQTARAPADAQQPKSPLDAYLNGNSTEAAIEGFGQTASMGYLPQLQAVAAKLIPDPNAELDEKLTAQGFNVQGPKDDYVSNRDRFIQRGRRLGEENPVAMGAGKVAGALTSIGIPGGAALKGASTGAKTARAVGMAGLQGYLYNPGDKEGEYEGVESLADPERLKQAGMSAATAGVMTPVVSGIGKLANKHRLFQKVKDRPGEVVDDTKAAIDSALGKYRAKEIAPKAQKLKELMGNETMEINPDRLKGISRGLDRYAARLDKRIPKTSQVVDPGTPELIDAGGRSIKPPVTRRVPDELRVPLSGTKALRLRKLLDARAQYKSGALHQADPGVLKAGETAKSAADILREQIRGSSDEAAGLLAEQQTAIKLSDALAKPAQRNPIAAIRPSTDLQKQGILNSIDKSTGSKLKTLGKDIEDVRKLQMEPRKFVRPLEAPAEMLKLGRRVVGRGARMAEPALNPEMEMTLLQILNEARREK